MVVVVVVVMVVQIRAYCDDVSTWHLFWKIPGDRLDIPSLKFNTDALSLIDFILFCGNGVGKTRDHPSCHRPVNGRPSG